MAAGLPAVSSTLTAGVGRGAVRRIRLGRADSIEIGSLKVQNVPVAIRAPLVGGPARWKGQSLSPIGLGLSVSVDYQRKRVTFARQLHDEPSSGVTLLITGAASGAAKPTALPPASVNVPAISAINNMVQQSNLNQMRVIIDRNLPEAKRSETPCEPGSATLAARRRYGD